MKKIIILICMLLFVFFSFFMVKKYTIEAKPKKESKSLKVKEIKKEEYKYITIDNDNIEELLKENIEEVIEVKYVYEEQENIKNGFIIENDNTYYYENNEYVVGEKEIDGYLYYFNNNGVLEKNFFNNKKYYDEEGKRVLGFKDINDNTYYFNEEGYVSGINEIENDIYYFNEEGILQRDTLKDNCYYDIDGKLYTGFKEIENNIYYFTKDGYLIGLNDIDNKKYYFDDEGHLITNCFYNNYYLDSNGEVTIGEKEINGRIYIFNEDGILQNGFQVIDGNEYFLDENFNKVTGLQLIDNIRYYFDFETGVLIKKGVKSVIDISSWQGDIDFDLLNESKLIDGVIVRLGYGTTLNDDPVLDNKFKRNISELKRINMPYGIYFFGYAQNEYASSLEANFVSNVLKEVDAKLSFPIFYDAELTNYDGVNYTKTIYRKVINNFVEKIKESGYSEVGLYGNLYMLSKGTLSFSKKYPVWVAQYYNRCEYEKEYIGWQYTSDGIIPGIEGRVDMNIFY